MAEREKVGWFVVEIAVWPPLRREKCVAVLCLPRWQPEGLQLWVVGGHGGVEDEPGDLRLRC